MKSKGHLFFVKIQRNPEMMEMVEYYQRDRTVRRAPLSDAIMPDGFRTGRYECAIEQLPMLKGILHSSHLLVED